MNKKGLIKELAKREGKKSQVSVGNLREIVKILGEIQADCNDKEEDGPCVLIQRAAIKIKAKKDKASK